MENKTILYILIRNDLPSMNAGKAMAQASHASAQFVNKMIDKEDLSYVQWSNEGKGFGTTIVLEGSYSDIKNITSDIIIGGYEKGNIIDETYPFKGQKEIIDLMDKDDIEKHNIIIVDDTVDKFGMVSCTRREHTCSWIFFSGNEEEHIKFKKICEAFNIYLHR